MDKSISILDAFVVGALVARYLGPEGLGTLAYAMASVTVAATFITLGMDTVLTREIVREPERAGALFWSVATARLCLGLAVFLFFAISVVVRNHGASLGSADTVLLVFAASLVFAPMYMLKLLLDCHVAAKWYVLVNNSLLLGSAAVKCWLVYQTRSIVDFAILNLASGIVAGVALLLIVHQKHFLPKFTAPDWGVFAALLKECWPLFISALGIGIYTSSDVIMLKWMSSESEAGIYSVATRLSSVWYFIPLIFATTFQPNLTKIHKYNPIRYLNRLQWQFDINSIAAYACVLVALVCFPALLQWLYGEAYRESISIFYIHIWAVPFVFLGVARNQHLTLESLHVFNMLSTIGGAGTNVVLNLLLIPQFGAHGAAVATVVSFCVSTFAGTFIVRNLRPIAWLQTRALLTAPWRLCREPVF